MPISMGVGFGYGADVPRGAHPALKARPEWEVTMRRTQAIPDIFTTFPGKCFRYVDADNGHARHCPNPVVCSGEFIDSRGKGWTVDACDEHLAELNVSRGAD